jgi:hypothetical protein
VCAFANTATTTCPKKFIITFSPFNFYDSMMCARAKVCVRVLLLKSDDPLWGCRFLPTLSTAKK